MQRGASRGIGPSAPSVLAALSLLLAGGCTWISPGQLEDRRGQVDDDQDGYISSEDCDDADSAIFPGADEIWYDGIDEDCAGDDDFDLDADGYVEDAFVGTVTLGVSGSGGLPGGDCNDADPAAHPSAEDAWYDGVDTDCGGEDDFDVDGDGFASLEHAASYIATVNAEGTGSLPATDCADEDEEIHPGTVEVWYDGVDADCDGQSDYDVDGDGWLPADYASPGVDIDCADDPEAEGSPCSTPEACAEFNPSATESWYDGYDQDCAGDDDYDADADGWVPIEWEGKPTAGVDGSGALPGDDCADDPIVDCAGSLTNCQLINPAQIEVIGDPSNLDEDCDGAPDSFAFTSLPDFSFQGPSGLQFGQNSSHVYLFVSADYMEFIPPGTTSTTSLYQSVVAAGFAITELTGGIDDLVQWYRSVTEPTWSRTTPMDFTVTDDAMYGAFGYTYTSSGSRGLRLGIYNLDPVERLGAPYVTAAYAPFEDISIQVDAEGDLHAIGCESTDGVAQYMWASPATLDSARSDGQETLDLVASRCELSLRDAPDGVVLANGSGALDTWGFTVPESTDDEIVSLSLLDSDSGLDPADITDTEEGTFGPWTVIADELNNQIVFFDGSGNEYDANMSGGVTRVAVAVDSSGDLVVAYVDGSGNLGVLWGDPTTPAAMDSYLYSVGFTVEEPAVAFEEDTGSILLAALGGDEVVMGVAQRY